MYPAVSIVDPDLIKTFPRSIIASTGLDTLTHVVEAFLSKPVTLITDTNAMKAVALILGSIEKAVRILKRIRKPARASCTGAPLPVLHLTIQM